MSTRSDKALHALAHVLRERKGLLTVLRDQTKEVLYRKALDDVLKAVDEVEDAWAENERKS